MRSKEILEKCGELAKQIRDMADLVHKENRDFSAEETEKFNTLSGEYDKLKARADMLKRADALDVVTDDRSANPIKPSGAVEKPGDTKREKTGREKQDIATRAWFRTWQRQRIQISDDERDALQSSDVRIKQEEIDLRLFSTEQYKSFRRTFRNGGRDAAEARTMSAVDGTAGGFLTGPSAMAAGVELAMLAFGGVREVATVIRTDTANPIYFPTVNDTSNTGELVGENTTTSYQDIAVATVKLTGYKFGSKAEKIPFELMRDSFYNVEQLVAQANGTRLARVQNTYFTTGTGGSQPQGIVTAATNGKTAAGSTSWTADEMLDLLHSVDPSYRNGASWMFNDASLLAIRKLKTGDGQYIWQPGLLAGVPDMIFGYRYTINQAMASASSGAKPLLFGDFSKYYIRDVGVIRVSSTNDLFWATDQTGFVAWMESDAGLIDAGTHPVKCMTMT